MKPSQLTALAPLLVHLGRHARRAGQLEEALAAASAAVAAYRAIESRQPESTGAGLAEALLDAAEVNAQMHRFGKASAIAFEAVELYRTLATERDPIHLPDLAGALRRAASYATAANRLGTAHAACEEAVALLRDLAALDRRRHRHELTEALALLARLAADTGRRKEAAARFREGLDMLKALPNRTAGDRKSGLTLATLFRDQIELEALGDIAPLVEQAAARFQRAAPAPKSATVDPPQ